MSRKDNKGRVLRKGESQRKDGRYCFKYNSATGVRFIYSWKLVSTDKLPKNKRECVSLREMEEEIQRDIFDGIDTVHKKITVCELYEKFIATHPNVRKNTLNTRNATMAILQKNSFGQKPIDSVNQSDAKAFIIQLHQQGYAYLSLRAFTRTMSAIFHMAIQDNCIRKNPFKIALKDIIEDDRKKKVALTAKQQENLLAFFTQDHKNDRLNIILFILLNTGLRVSELVGLTLADVDFDKRLIHVNHQLLKDKDGYYINPPKTESGKRIIPIHKTVCYAIKRQLKLNTEVDKAVLEVDGYKDFIFYKKDGELFTKSAVENALIYFKKRYKKRYSDEELPNITPHLLRHTFCTNMATKGMSPTNLQYIMGHKRIAMTLEYYTHPTYESAKQELDRLTAIG